MDYGTFNTLLLILLETLLLSIILLTLSLLLDIAQPMELHALHPLTAQAVDLALILFLRSSPTLYPLDNPKQLTFLHLLMVPLFKLKLELNSLSTSLLMMPISFKLLLQLLLPLLLFLLELLLPIKPIAILPTVAVALDAILNLN